MTSVPIVFDIETNGLLDTCTKIHCISLFDTQSNSFITYSDKGPYERLEKALEQLSSADCLIGHNILCFDLPVIKKIYPGFSMKSRVRDTLVMSRLIWPALVDDDFKEMRKAKTPSSVMFNFPTNLAGSHSLKAWGYRLGVLKGTFGENTDWHDWSEEMCAYNRQDVVVTKQLWELIASKHYSPQAIELEHGFQKIIFQQEQNGFPFDTEKAVQFYSQLSSRREKLTQQLQQEFPPIDKGCWFVPKVNNKTRGYVKDQKVWKPKLSPFNPASRKDIAERLMQKYNWVPKELTEKGAAKVDEDVLNTLPYAEAKPLSEFFLIQKRIGQLAEGNNAWLKLVASDGRIHGHVITNGAVTGRCTHINPNMAQVPSVNSPWGEEFRSLFYAPDGWLVLGADASGLELRCLAHYLARYDGGAYAQKILAGDIHWSNAQLLGLVGKDEKKDPNNPHHMWARNKVAKRFIYALNYGAGDHKLGEVVDLTTQQAQDLLQDTPKKKVDELSAKLSRQYPHKTITSLDVAQSLKGHQLRTTFLKNLPALNTLIKDVKEVVQKRGYLIGVDKRILKVRSLHSAFNTLLQSAGAIAVKKATCILWADLRAAGIASHVQQVAHVHDEYQLLVEEGYENRVGDIAVEALRKSGEYFRFRISLDGEYKVGRNWAETH